MTDALVELWPCLWCGKPYAEHADQRGDLEPVPKMPCLGLKRGFAAAAPPAVTGLERISPLEREPWEYRRPVLAGFYWWQEQESLEPLIVELEAEGLENRWLARIVATAQAIPLDRGRWCRIDLPQAFAEWRH